jgi:hypothetical protein
MTGHLILASIVSHVITTIIVEIADRLGLVNSSG